MIRWIISLCLASLAFCGAAEPRPNILLLIGDNWLYDHAGANGDPVVKTPVFDRIAKEGTRFTNAFCPVPSCSPTRSCIVTGRAAHQLADAASLWSKFDGRFRVFGDALSESGYHVGFTGKGWSPRNFKDFGRTENPAGQQFNGLPGFMAERKTKQPFFFWLGSVHTALHQWKLVSAGEHGIDPAKVRVPSYLPDTAVVREEIAAYLAAVEKMDAAFGEAIDLLEEEGQLDNTIVIYTSDNGWQMPHGLANCYDSGSHVPLAIRWLGKIKAGRVIDDFISLTDLAPTFLEIAGLKPWPEMTGRSFVDVLEGKPSATPRDCVFIERERHANVRRGDLSYPIRGIRTKDFLYLRNLRPDRWPAGDPELYFAVGPYGDVDGTRTKEYILSNSALPEMKRFFDLNFAKRPSEELYDLATDPDQIHNLAADPAHEKTKQQLRTRVDQWMRETGDPRVNPTNDSWDAYPYFGGKAKISTSPGSR
jgi:N-sulfoglucosamine sulfohydrolase